MTGRNSLVVLFLSCRLLLAKVGVIEKMQVLRRKVHRFVKFLTIFLVLFSYLLYFCTEIERINNWHEDIVSRTD